MTEFIYLLLHYYVGLLSTPCSLNFHKIIHSIYLIQISLIITSCHSLAITTQPAFWCKHRKQIFSLNFASNLSLFLPFSAFQHNKCWKSIFRPAFAMPSTQTLVEIYNRKHWHRQLTLICLLSNKLQPNLPLRLRVSNYRTVS